MPDNRVRETTTTPSASDFASAVGTPLVVDTVAVKAYILDSTGAVAEIGVGPFGDVAGGDYAEFQSDGSLVLYGEATAFRDEFGPLIGARLESPASKIVTNAAEGSLTFKDSATLVDYVVTPVQINHDAVTGAVVRPHVHWWQASSNIPNWLLQYRWQVNGTAKTTAWTNVKYVSHAFTYTSGTLNQITGFGALTPPVGAGVSTILQLRLLRDTANASTLFSGADPLTGDVEAVSFDVHIQVDMLGSRGEYSK